MASSNLAGVFAPAEKESWYHLVFHKHVAYVPELHFVHYSSLTPRINILCRSFSPAPLFFFFFWLLSLIFLRNPDNFLLNNCT